MENLIRELIVGIDLFANSKISGEELENRTSKLIVREDYEKLPEEIQRTVELLDMWEIEQLTAKDLQEAKDILNNFLEKKVDV